MERACEEPGLHCVSSLPQVVSPPTYLRTTLGMSSREYFTKAYLRPLVEAGLIERNDPDHPNSPQQKYAITKDGESGGSHRYDKEILLWQSSPTISFPCAKDRR